MYKKGWYTYQFSILISRSFYTLEIRIGYIESHPAGSYFITLAACIIPGGSAKPPSRPQSRYAGVFAVPCVRQSASTDSSNVSLQKVKPTQFFFQSTSRKSQILDSRKEQVARTCGVAKQDPVSGSGALITKSMLKYYVSQARDACAVSTTAIQIPRVRYPFQRRTYKLSQTTVLLRHQLARKAIHSPNRHKLFLRDGLKNTYLQRSATIRACLGAFRLSISNL